MTRPFTRFGFILLVLLAVMARAVIPAGFMPELTDGKMAITICHGADIKTVLVDVDGQPTQKTACPFKFMPQTADNGQKPVLLESPVAYTDIRYTHALMATPHRIPLQRGLSRAPPVIL